MNFRDELDGWVYFTWQDRAEYIQHWKDKCRTAIINGHYEINIWPPKLWYCDRPKERDKIWTVYIRLLRGFTNDERLKLRVGSYTAVIDLRDFYNRRSECMKQ